MRLVGFKERQLVTPQNPQTVPKGEGYSRQQQAERRHLQAPWLSPNPSSLDQAEPESSKCGKALAFNKFKCPRFLLETLGHRSCSTHTHLPKAPRNERFTSSSCVLKKKGQPKSKTQQERDTRADSLWARRTTHLSACGNVSNTCVEFGSSLGPLDGFLRPPL